MPDNSIIFRMAHSVTLSSGARRSLIAFFAGLIGSTALPPLNFYPALAVTMSIAVWIIDGCVAGSASALRPVASAIKSVAIAGWWLGFGYFLGGLWWVGAPFLVEADKFAWALPLGVVGLPAGLALFTALGCIVSWALWSGRGGRIFALAVGLGMSEWLRSSILTGFPWNNFGMALGANIYLAQFASIIGLHGLTFIAIAVAAAPATLIDTRQGAAVEPSPGLHYAPTLLAGLTVVLLAGFGVARVNTITTEFTPGIQLRLMQPNVPQDEKFRPDRGMQILERYLKLSDSSSSPQSAGIASATHLFWPESPFPFILSRTPEALARIGKFLPRGTVLITGAARMERDDSRTRGVAASPAKYYNSIQVIEAEGVISQSYDKIRLVPFGEFLPFENLLRKANLDQFVHVPGGFQPGRNQRVLRIQRIGLTTPLICYEAIFPGAITSRKGDGEPIKLLVNVTNDGWFGVTSGPYQHLFQARLRAIETGVPMVRVANTGISAAIDPVGRIMKSLPLGAEGVIDTGLPIALPTTIFSRYGTAAPGGVALLIALLAFAAGRIRRA